MLLSGRHVEAAKPILVETTRLAGLLGLVLMAGGIYLGYFSRFAETELHLFGTSLKSTSVGVAMVFIGAVMVARIISRTLTSLETLAKLPDDPSAPAPAPLPLPMPVPVRRKHADKHSNKP